MRPAPLPLDGDLTCSMPGCGRLSCFHVRLETASAPDDGRAGDSCGAHLAEVVQELASWAREQRRDPASQVVVYAMTDGRANEASGPVEPFDRLALGTIPI
ncbi:hypothetical protein E1281_22980 [Actinomadura sp. KC345]|uniref:hypothetical protein n=1 Tax=Actinomadura sp. KC345 TaxID=2530371 RepID=UPI0010537F51|nr:hypothetical protein [Actinomadura sp. KC345]TDC49668.1 hypothetical protein E1281_22980 [Actinomadura sp. KC345]